MTRVVSSQFSVVSRGAAAHLKFGNLLFIIRHSASGGSYRKIIKSGRIHADHLDHLRLAPPRRPFLSDRRDHLDHLDHLASPRRLHPAHS